MTFAIARGVPAAGILFAGTMMIGVALTLSCVAILSILLRERLVHFVEGRPRLFEAITRSIEGVAGAALIALAMHEIFLRCGWRTGGFRRWTLSPGDQGACNVLRAPKASSRKAWSISSGGSLPPRSSHQLMIDI